MSYNNKLHILWAVCHIWLLVILVTEFSAAYLLAGYLIYLLVKGLGSEIGAHRHWSHRSFETTAAWKKILISLQTLCGEGSILTFVGIHRLHHAFSDTPRDPHSPHHGSIFSVCYFTKPTVIDLRLVRDIRRDRLIVLQHQYYWHVHVLLLILGIFMPVYYAYFIALPVILSIYTNALVNIACHRWGTQDNISRDHSKNNRWLNTVLYGAGLHNNHHTAPQNYRNSEKISQDILGWIIHRYIRRG